MYNKWNQNGQKPITKLVKLSADQQQQQSTDNYYLGSPNLSDQFPSPCIFCSTTRTFFRFSNFKAKKNIEKRRNDEKMRRVANFPTLVQLLAFLLFFYIFYLTFFGFFFLALVAIKKSQYVYRRKEMTDHAPCLSGTPPEVSPQCVQLFYFS